MLRQDDAAALKRYRLAADQGHAKAQNNLGILYSESATFPRDYIAAFMWIKLAQQHGFTDAKNGLDSLSVRMRPDQIDKAQSTGRRKIGHNATLGDLTDVKMYRQGFSHGGRGRRIVDGDTLKTGFE